MGCISEGKEAEYWDVLDSFAKWCGGNHLQWHCTSTSKTKKFVMDFSRQKTTPTPVSIQGVDMDTMQDYENMGVYLEEGPELTLSHFLWRPRSFSVCSTMLRMFYKSVATAIFFAVMC